MLWEHKIFFENFLSDHFLWIIPQPNSENSKPPNTLPPSIVPKITHTTSTQNRLSPFHSLSHPPSHLSSFQNPKNPKNPKISQNTLSHPHQQSQLTHSSTKPSSSIPIQTRQNLPSHHLHHLSQNTHTVQNPLTTHKRHRASVNPTQVSHPPL